MYNFCAHKDNIYIIKNLYSLRFVEIIDLEGRISLKNINDIYLVESNTELLEIFNSVILKFNPCKSNIISESIEFSEKIKVDALFIKHNSELETDKIRQYTAKNKMKFKKEMYHKTIKSKVKKKKLKKIMESKVQRKTKNKIILRRSA